jgi:hypothetical protein
MMHVPHFTISFDHGACREDVMVIKTSLSHGHDTHVQLELVSVKPANLTPSYNRLAFWLPSHPLGTTCQV